MKRSKKLKSIIENWKNPRYETYFDFDNISSYFDHKSADDDAKYISDELVDDVDLDDVFTFLDRTSSKIGQQFLYYKLRSIEESNSSELLDLFTNNEQLRLKVQLLLSRLNTQKTYDFEKLFNNQFVKPKFEKYFVILLIVSLISFMLAFKIKYFILLIIPIFFINSVLHYSNKKYTSFFFNGLNQMIMAYKVAKKLLAIEEIRTATHQNEEFLASIKKLKKRTYFILFGEMLNHPMSIVFWLVFEVIKIFFNLEGIIFYSLFDSIKKQRKNIEELFVFIGKVDVAISQSAIVTYHQTCRPQFVDKKVLKVREIYHPLIPNCVKNDLELVGKSLLLTGSNMSGKSTFIRTIAINNILAQTLNFCFATEYTTSKFKVSSSIRITDDLFEQKSFYLQEVLRIKQLIDVVNCKSPNLFVLDEIFKGTNTIERIAASKSVLSYLNTEKHLVLVSTHDIELVDLLKNENFDQYHFTEKIIDNQLIFDYKIKEGALQTRNAIKILELYNYPSEIITQAKNIENVIEK